MPGSEEKRREEKRREEKRREEPRQSLPDGCELEWHSHPMPSAGYLVSGELTLERKKDGKKQHFTAGQTVPETIDTFHRGITGDEPVVLIMFYAGSADEPLTQYPRH